MTRINLIPVDELTDQHLLAEHREIKRIPNTLIKGKSNLDDIPQTYRMGKGHVRFFYDKPIFLYSRYVKLYVECLKRGFNVKWYGKPFIRVILMHTKYTTYTPSGRDIKISRDRIEEKIRQKPNYYKYWGKPIEVLNYEERYTKHTNPSIGDG